MATEVDSVLLCVWSIALLVHPKLQRLLYWYFY